MKLAIKQKQQKENTFVTGVGLYSDSHQPDEEEEKPPTKEEPPYNEDEDDDKPYENFDENAYLKEL